MVGEEQASKRFNLCTCNDFTNFAGDHETCDYVMADGRIHRNIPKDECGCTGSG